MKEIKIALVHDYLMQLGGAERMLEEIASIFPQADIFCPVVDRRIAEILLPGRKVKESGLFRGKFFKDNYRLFFLMFPHEIERFNFEGYDIIISDSSAWVKNIIVPFDSVHISYIYTPMRFAWNYYFQELNDYSYFQRNIMRIFIHFIRLWDKISTDRIDEIITISDHVKRRIKKYYNRDSQVIYPFVDWDYYIPSNYKGDYFLLVSRFRSYKKVDLAIRAFQKIKDKLIIIGKGEKLKEYKKMLTPNIQILTDVDDDHLREYYAACRAFIFPQEEDFGITPLEAQACGRPVIAFRKGGATETVLEGKTGLFFDRQNEISLLKAIEKFKKMENTFDKDNIRAWAKNFSKDVFRERFENSILKILKEKGTI